jgi:hypothetical protein
MSELVVTSELSEALKTVLSSFRDTKGESRSMILSDTLKASEIEPVNKEVASPMDDGLVEKDAEELMLLLNSVLAGDMSLLDVR